MNPHRPVFSQYPLAQLAAAFSAGIVVADYFPTRLVLVAAGVCSALALVLLLKRRLRTAGFVLLLAVFFAGDVLTMLERRSEQTSLKRFLDDHEGESLLLTGV